MNCCPLFFFKIDLRILMSIHSSGPCDDNRWIWRWCFVWPLFLRYDNQRETWSSTSLFMWDQYMNLQIIHHSSSCIPCQYGIIRDNKEAFAQILRDYWLNWTVINLFTHEEYLFIIGNGKFGNPTVVPIFPREKMIIRSRRDQLFWGDKMFNLFLDIDGVNL